MSDVNYDPKNSELRRKRICRFCLTQDASIISNIFTRDTRIRASAPLPIQIMAIASIEVISNDNMPCFVCSDCTDIFEFSYQFKQMCKKADNLLRQFPLTGKWPICLKKPILPKTTKIQTTVIDPSKQKIKTTDKSMQSSSKTTAKKEIYMPIKILNSDIKNPDVTLFAPKIAPKVVTKMEVDDCTFTLLDKLENNDELSLDDIQQLVAAEELDEANAENLNLIESRNKSTKPKLLNKSVVRILNKHAEIAKEPRMSLPKVKKDADGKMEIVAEILDINGTYEDEADPTKAIPITTNIFPCNHCERSFPLLQLLDIHLKNHVRDRQYLCDWCDKSFFSKYDLTRHFFIHNGIKPFKCSACDKAFSRSSLLTRHEKTHTDVPKFICIHCERAFITKKDMDKHTERHNVHRPFVCKVCNKGFVFKQGLERHEVVHSKQQPFSCHYCDKSFSTTTKLARHLTAHAGRRPYPCKLCRKSYLLSHHLTRHMRSHKNNDNVFTCSVCNYSLKTRDELIHHSTTHANATNTTCSLCKEEFQNINTLNDHIEEHANSDTFACEFCDLIFTTSQKLQIHTDKDHCKDMEIYHADKKGQSDNEFLNYEVDDIPQKKIKIEKDIYSEPMGQNSEDKNNVKKQIEDSIILAPVKQQSNVLAEIKPSIETKKSPKRNKESPESKRQVANAKAKLPKSVSLIKTRATNASIIPTNILPKPKLIKIEKNTTPAAELSSKSNEKDTNIEDKTIKVRKIAVAKAQVAAMAKEGRIKIKDGKMILKE